MGILDLVLQRLSVAEVTEETDKTIAAVGQYIKEYCCLTEIPENLYPLWADMVYELLNQDEIGEGLSFAGLTSVSMGDAAYSFNGRDDSAKEALDKLLADYRHRLNKVRRGLFR